MFPQYYRTMVVKTMCLVSEKAANNYESVEASSQAVLDTVREYAVINCKDYTAAWLGFTNQASHL